MSSNQLVQRPTGSGGSGDKRTTFERKEQEAQQRRDKVQGQLLEQCLSMREELDRLRDENQRLRDEKAIRVEAETAANVKHQEALEEIRTWQVVAGALAVLLVVVVIAACAWN
jgi:hypothetical protein